jgi:hypothetical protein
LQPAAVDRDLRPVVTRGKPARLAPDGLAELVEHAPLDAGVAGGGEGRNSAADSPPMPAPAINISISTG